MSRWVYLLGVGLTLVALGLAFTDWVISLQPGVTEANVRRIRPGMTLADVEALLGSWTANVGERESARECMVILLDKSHSSIVIWSDPRGDATVLFRLGGRVQKADWATCSGESFLVRVRGWLGW
jgi:hypothetical protein